MNTSDTSQGNTWIPNPDYGSDFIDIGNDMYEFARRIFPLNRSITGDGVRATLSSVQEILGGLEIHEVPSGTQCFDWSVPEEWSITEAYIADLDGNRIVDFQENNLHVVGYSEPVDQIVDRGELERYLHSIPEKPDTIPYVTSYYHRTWGFCLSDNRRKSPKDSRYRVVVRSELKQGSLTYGELVIPGEVDKEILLSTYTCHPSLANNEVSGPTLATFLGRYIQERKRKFTYRILYLPETIGPIVYLSRNLERLKENVIAGFVLTCVGDDRTFSFMPSRHGNTVADHAALTVLEKFAPKFVSYDYVFHRGSDERQYCSPGVDLPVVSIMRTAYGRYPEYHTSDDDLNVISPRGFSKSVYLHMKVLDYLETLKAWRSANICEPQLSRRNYRSTFGGQRGTIDKDTKLVSDILAMSDGLTASSMIARKLGYSTRIINNWCNQLQTDNLLCEVY